MKIVIRVFGILIGLLSLILLIVSWAAVFGLAFGAILVFASFGMTATATPTDA